MLAVNELTHFIIGRAMQVHRALGPGLLETAYEACLHYELHQSGTPVRRQVRLPVVYGAVRLTAGYVADLVVADTVIVEVKAVERLLQLHEMQVATYLRMSGLRVGLLLNFNVMLLADGIRRISL